MSRVRTTENSPPYVGMIVICVICVFSVLEAQTEQYYVRAEATGLNDGSDWENAYRALPSVLRRGATYFITSGEYPSYVFDDPVNGSQTIIIKKATPSDHGTERGWQRAFGVGLTTFARLDFGSSYWELDGNTGSIGQYGIRVSGTSPLSNLDVGVGTATSVDFITVRDVTVDSRGVANVRGIHVELASQLVFSNVESWNADNDTVSLINVSNSIFEYLNLHTRINAGVGTHADAIEVFGGTENTLRYSKVNWDGQQIFFGGGSTHGVWRIYGNRLYGGPTAGKGIHAQSTNPRIGPIFVYNNTLSGLNASLTLGSNTYGDAKNNIFFQTTVPSWGAVTHDYNWFETGMRHDERHGAAGADPFLDHTSNDFRLLRPIGVGLPLLAPYDYDAEKRRRGIDSNWDVGALEHAEGMQTPRNLRVVPGTNRN